MEWWKRKSSLWELYTPLLPYELSCPCVGGLIGRSVDWSHNFIKDRNTCFTRQGATSELKWCSSLHHSVCLLGRPSVSDCLSVFLSHFLEAFTWMTHVTPPPPSSLSHLRYMFRTNAASILRWSNQTKFNLEKYVSNLVFVLAQAHGIHSWHYCFVA